MSDSKIFNNILESNFKVLSILKLTNKPLSKEELLVYDTYSIYTKFYLDELSDLLHIEFYERYDFVKRLSLINKSLENCYKNKLVLCDFSSNCIRYIISNKGIEFLDTLDKNQNYLSKYLVNLSYVSNYLTHKDLTNEFRKIVYE